MDDDQLRLLALGIEAVAKLEIHRGAADLSSGASVLETLTGRLDARVLSTLFEERWEQTKAYLLVAFVVVYLSSHVFPEKCLERLPEVQKEKSSAFIH